MVLFTKQALRASPMGRRILDAQNVHVRSFAPVQIGRNRPRVHLRQGAARGTTHFFILIFFNIKHNLNSE
jgi:hypothetical protein